MSDIVERLRSYAKDQGGWHNIDDTCEEAADALTTLSARLAEVERELANAEELHRDAAHECEQYSNEIAAQRGRADSAEARLAECERERDIYRTVLEAAGYQNIDSIADREDALQLGAMVAQLTMAGQAQLASATARAERAEAALLSVQRMFRLDLYKQIEDGPHYNQALKDVSNRVNAALADAPEPAQDDLIKKCPFCGAAPHQNLGKVQSCQMHGEPIQDYTLKCPHGCAQATGANKKLAITKWNRRIQY